MCFNLVFAEWFLSVIFSCVIAGKRVEEGVNETFENQSVASSQGSLETQSNPADDVESTDGMY